MTWMLLALYIHQKVMYIEVFIIYHTLSHQSMPDSLPMRMCFIKGDIDVDAPYIHTYTFSPVKERVHYAESLYYAADG